MPLQIFAPPDAEHLDLLVFLGRCGLLYSPHVF